MEELSMKLAVQDKFRARGTLLSELSGPICSSSSPLTHLPPTAHTHLALPSSLYFPEEISKELPFSMEGPLTQGMTRLTLAL